MEEFIISYIGYSNTELYKKKLYNLEPGSIKKIYNL